MLRYLRCILGHLVALPEGKLDVRHLAATIGLAPILDALQAHWSGFPLSSPVVWAVAFWAGDWVAGSLVALRAKQWRARRGLYSVVKLLIWIAALAVAYGLRDSGAPGCGLAAGAIEAAVLLTEGSSVLRNLALLSDNEAARRVLSVYADTLEWRVGKRKEKQQ